MNHRRGFTLIELLAGLALTGLLTAALFHTVNAVVRSDRQLAAEPRSAQTPWGEAMRVLMQADLEQAVAVNIDRNTIVIEGWCARDTAQGTRDHRPVRVTYRRVGTESALLREQTALGGVRVEAPQRELVAVGVNGWAIGSRGKLTVDASGVRGGSIELVLPASVREGGQS